MTIKEMYACWFVDDDMGDGLVRVDCGESANEFDPETGSYFGMHYGVLRHFQPHSPKAYMSHATFRALFVNEGAFTRLHAHIKTLPERYTSFLLPRGVVEPGEAEDLRRGLDLVEPQPSEYCIYPPCVLRAEVVHSDGFPLCRTHAELMEGWEVLSGGDEA